MRMYKDTINIPTYEVGKPEINPMFYNGRRYQGAQGRIYPYALLNNLSNKKVDKKYTAVFLENEFVKICILPKLGGRLHYAIDKSNGYDFIYRNPQIKPALIGMTGAWISGGIEWSIPHHHRASTFLPIDYTLEEHEDGSKTIWIGEIELRHGMAWSVGYTMYPDKSYFETEIRVNNRTPLAQSFLVWANTAVHATDDYQVVFPPDVQYATFHSKTEFTEWPVSNQKFAGSDYSEGVNVSYLKNHPTWNSFFAWGSDKNFLAGIDHGRNAGLTVVADDDKVPGKKLWSWGEDGRAEMWNDMLTDTGGPYVELMTGAFSDNQPDYSWAHPYMVKRTEMHFYPTRDLNHVKSANLNGSLNLEIQSSGKALLQVSPTSTLTDAVLQLTGAGGATHLDRRVELGPAQPFSQTIPLPEGTDKTDLSAALLSASGDTLLSYQPKRREKTEMPEPVTPPKAPGEIETVEKLYKEGLRLEQFYNPSIKPTPYYERALKLDPGNIDVNTQMGLMYLKKNKLQEAEQHLRKAKERLTADYTSPKDGEALYYLGLTLKRQGELEEAYDLLYKATWNYAWYAPGHYLLAEISAKRGDDKRALEHLKRASETNTLSPTISNLKATILRKQGQVEDSREVVTQVLEDYPLNHWANYERRQARKKQGRDLQQIASTQIFRGDPENYITLAVDYGNAGFYEEAADVLREASSSSVDSLNKSPMVYYFLGYYSEKSGSPAKAETYYRKANSLSTDYVFPHRFEAIAALKNGLKYSSDEAKIHYYLGNILYDDQPGEAIKAWKKAVAADTAFAIAHRNLGFAYANARGNPEKAARHMEKAIQYNPDVPRYYYEIDQYYERIGVEPEKRLALLKKHHETVRKGDRALTREVLVSNIVGEYERAIDLMNGHHFNKWEGVGSMHDHWVDAHVLRARGEIENGSYQNATSHLQKALTYPRNLEEGRNDRESEIFYWLGEAHLRAGDEGEARKYFEKAASNEEGGGKMKFYRALANQEIGNQEKAQEMFSDLIERGRKELKGADREDVYATFSEDEFPNAAKADAHYLMGLGYLGLGKESQAEKEFETAVELNPAHLYAKIRKNKTVAYGR